MRSCVSFLSVIVLVGCHQQTPETSSFSRSLNLGQLVKDVAPAGADWREEQGGASMSREPGAAELEVYYTFRIRGDDEVVSAFMAAVRDRLASDIQSAGGTVADSEDAEGNAYSIGDARGQISFKSVIEQDADHPYVAMVTVRESVGE